MPRKRSKVITKVMQSFEGVAASSTATLRLPPGWTYHTLYLTYANALADLTEIRLLINGVVEQRFTGTELDATNRFWGRTAAAGIIAIDLIRKNLRTRLAEEYTALGTGIQGDPRPVQTLSLEVDLSATPAPALSCIAEVSDARMSLGVKRVQKFTYSPSGAGVFEIADLPKGEVVNAIHLNSAAIVDVEIEKDNFSVYKRTNAQNVLIVQDGYRQRVSQANYHHFDPTENGHGNEWVKSNVHDFRLKVNVSAATTLIALVEYVGLVR